MVVTQGKVMVVIDVPVDAGKNLSVALISREICVRTCVVTVFVLYKVRNLLKILQSGT